MNTNNVSVSRAEVVPGEFFNCPGWAIKYRGEKLLWTDEKDDADWYAEGFNDALERLEQALAQPSEHPAKDDEAADMEAIGRAFMDSVKRNEPNAMWGCCPTELYVRALDRVFDAEKAAEQFIEYTKGKLDCGHTIGDLIYSPGSVTKCGACVAAKAEQPGDVGRDWPEKILRKAAQYAADVEDGKIKPAGDEVLSPLSVVRADILLALRYLAALSPGVPVAWGLRNVEHGGLVGGQLHLNKELAEHECRIPTRPVYPLYEPVAFYLAPANDEAVRLYACSRCVTAPSLSGCPTDDCPYIAERDAFLASQHEEKG